jgi:hypothetical protein
MCSFGRVPHSRQRQNDDWTQPNSDCHTMYVCVRPVFCLAVSLLCLTRVGRTPPLAVCTSRQVFQLCLFKVNQNSRAFHSTCDASIDTVSHRAHTDPARSPKTMRTSPTLGCLFTPSTSTPTTCLPTSLTLPRILSPVAPR